MGWWKKSVCSVGQGSAESVTTPKQHVMIKYGKTMRTRIITCWPARRPTLRSDMFPTPCQRSQLGNRLVS